MSKKYLYTILTFLTIITVGSVGFGSAFGYGGGGSSGGGGGSAPQSSAGGGGGGGGGVPFSPVVTPVDSPDNGGEGDGGQVLGISTFNFATNLRRRDFNRDVTELQKRLMDEGYFIGPITGYFGPITFGAVQTYQAAHGIPNTGFVGPLTRASLNAQKTVNR